MAVNFLLKRTATAEKRPTAAQLAVGELALNYAADSPGLFLEDNSGAVRKIGPTHVGASAPNSSAAGQAGNSTGEMWLDNTDGGATLKVYDGSAWQSASIPGISTATSSVALAIDSNNRIGIGTSSPGATLEISGDGANTGRVFLSQANATTDGVDITGKRSRGTIASPEGTTNGDALFKLFAQAYDGSAFVAAGNMGWTAADSSGNATFTLKTRSGSAVGDRLIIDSSGDTSITGALGVSSGITIGTTGSPFQASAENDVVTKNYGDATYLGAGTLATQISSQFGITRAVGTSGSVLEIGISDIDFQKNISFQQAAAFLAFQDNNSTALRIGEDDGDAYMTFDSTNDAEQVEFGKNISISAGTQLAMAGSTTITLLDNDFDALDIKEGNNLYMRFNTTNSGEKLQILKNIYLAAELHMADYVLMDNQKDLRFAELNSNGTNYLAIKAPAAVTTSTTFTLPDGDGSSGQSLRTNASGTLSWANTPTALFGINAHASWDGSAGGSFDWSSDKISEGNITSVTRTGQGEFTVTFDTDFSSANYTVIATAGGTDHSSALGTAGGRTIAVVSRSAGSMDIVVERADDAVNDDSSFINIAVIGTLS